jgi:hypothetical protein
LRPGQAELFLVTDTTEGVEHVVMLRYGERRVFLFDEVLDEVRCGPVIDCSVAVGSRTILACSKSGMRRPIRSSLERDPTMVLMVRLQCRSSMSFLTYASSACIPYFS